jgi:hypothetical protein
MSMGKLILRLARRVVRAWLWAYGLKIARELIDRRSWRKPNRWKGLLLGSIGGAIGTLAMSLYFKALSPFVDMDATTDDQDDSRSHALDSIALLGQHYQEDEGSTAAVGRLAYQTIAGAPPKAEETRTMLSELVHWSFGMQMGALYGAIRGPADMPDIAGGLGFGVGVWLLASELAVPLLGFAPGPTKFPLAHHANELGAHMVYGVTTAATTQALQRCL